MSESSPRKVKKVRFNEKVQVYIIQGEDKKSTYLRSLPTDWIRFVQEKPLSEKPKEPYKPDFGAGHLTPRQYRASDDLINFYLQRKEKQPFTYWDVIKTNPSLTSSSNTRFPQVELTSPKNRLFPNTPFSTQRRFSTPISQSSTQSLPRRTLDNKHGQFSEILAIYGNNPCLRTARTSQPEFFIGNMKNTQVTTINDKVHHGNAAKERR